MSFHGRMLKGFFIGFFGLFLLFPTIPGLSSAYALTDDLQQWFDSFTAGNPVTNAASLPVTSNWTITFDNSSGYTYTLAVTQFNSSAGGPVTSDGLVSYAPVTSMEPPYEYAKISAPSSSGCVACSAVTLTYTDAATTVLSGPYIMVDVLSLKGAKAFELLVTGTDGTTVLSPANDILNGCLSPPATIAGKSDNNHWGTVFVANTLSVPVSTVSLIIPNTYSTDLDQSDGDFVFVDDLSDSATLSCLVPPTSTFTMTFTPSNTFTLSPTYTPTYTSTQTPTNTLSPTATGTFTMTNTQTNTPTITNTSTITSTNTPTVSPTTTDTSVPSATSTSSFSPTITFTIPPTNTPVSTSTSTFTSTWSWTPTPSLTPTITSTQSFTFTPTHTYTFTITLTPTITFTPTITNTPPPSPTPTDTPCPVNVYPNPMDFQHNPTFNNQCPSSDPCIKFSCIPPQSTLNLYTITLSLVRSFGPFDPNYTYNSLTGTGLITWDGKNGDGNPVASGFYFYKIEGPNGQTFGKFAISRSLNGP